MSRGRVVALAVVWVAFVSAERAAADDPYDLESVRNGYFHTSTTDALASGGGYALTVNPYSGGYNLHLPIVTC